MTIYVKKDFGAYNKYFNFCFPYKKFQHKILVLVKFKFV